jgi:glycosyltransferase involved in cell wall biosynthesis
MADLFEILSRRQTRSPLASIWKKPYYKFLRKALRTDLKTDRVFVPLSHALEKELPTLGYPHTSVVYPPCDMIFKPRLKKKQVCLVSRIAPQKNIEDFMRIAQNVPAYRFILVGIHAHMDSGYTSRVLSIKSPNVDYIEARIRDRPELVEESKVYLYTSLEPGIGIALGQAMGAGCIPVTPAWGGGAEMVLESGVGYVYRTVGEAAQKVKNAVESSETRDSPLHVAERARVFSSEGFEEKLAKLVTESI